MNWAEFCKDGLPAWKKYSLQYKNTIFSEETELNNEHDYIEHTVSIKRTFCDVPVSASVLAGFEKDEAGEYTRELIPPVLPALLWDFVAWIHVPKIYDLSYGTLIGVDNLFFEMTILEEAFTGCDDLTTKNFAKAECIGSSKTKLLSENKVLENRLRENPYLIEAVETLCGRYGFALLPIVDKTVDGVECKQYSLCVESTVGAVNEDKIEPPPTTVESIAAIFTIYKEIIVELVLLGAIYRAPQLKKYYNH